VTCARQSDRTSAATFLAQAFRLLLACATYVLHHALRTHALQHTALAHAPPLTRRRPPFKVAPHVKPYKDRIRLHWPSSCPVQALLYHGTALLALGPLPAVHPS
jgi:hypothetical protein